MWAWTAQALQGELEVKCDALDKGTQTHQLLQAEIDRLRKAYEEERDTAQMLQQDKSTLNLKIKAKEQVHFCAHRHCSAHGTHQHHTGRFWDLALPAFSMARCMLSYPSESYHEDWCRSSRMPCNSSS